MFGGRKSLDYLALAAAAAISRHELNCQQSSSSASAKIHREQPPFGSTRDPTACRASASSARATAIRAPHTTHFHTSSSTAHPSSAQQQTRHGLSNWRRPYSWRPILALQSATGAHRLTFFDLECRRPEPFTIGADSLNSGASVYLQARWRQSLPIFSPATATPRAYQRRRRKCAFERGSCHPAPHLQESGIGNCTRIRPAVLVNIDHTIHTEGSGKATRGFALMRFRICT